MRPSAGLAALLLLCPAQPARAWTDDPLTTSIQVRKVHMDELRTAINNKRTDFGFSAASWTDPTITAGTTLIKKTHIDELRDKCDDITAAYNPICPGVVPATPAWGGITAYVTSISATHFTQLRTTADAIGTCASCCAQTCKSGTCNGSGCNNVANNVDGLNCTGSCTECDGAGACVNVSSARGGAQWPEGSPACPACQDCGDATGACVNLTTNEDAGCSGACTYCNNGTCTNNAQYDERTENCGITFQCQACNGSGSCVNLTNIKDSYGAVLCNGLCQHCDAIAMCEYVANGLDPYTECPGAHLCAATTCNGAGNCAVDNTKNSDCAACYKCSGVDNCVVQTAAEDIKNDCDHTEAWGCKTGLCNGSGGCTKYTNQTDPNLNCPSFCSSCGSLGSCIFSDAGTDPRNECPNATCKDVNCNGSGACQVVANNTYGNGCAGTLDNTAAAGSKCWSCDGASACVSKSTCGAWGNCGAERHCTTGGSCIADADGTPGGTCD
ncbi:MAG: hypothetical protein HY403_00415 [Elusimicrobia bacterium]|nr:hypothetical protein [Elusimicrobiota bacterium]